MDCQVICTWCGRHMGVKDMDVPASERRRLAASQGICQACLRRLLRRAMQSTLPTPTASR